MMRLFGLLLVLITLSLGSCQCSDKPDIGPVEEAPTASVSAVDSELRLLRDLV